MTRTEGIDDVVKFFNRYSKKVDMVVSDELEKGSKLILSDSNLLAPRDTGEMIRQTSIFKDNDLRYEVRYNTDYSLYVHEDLEARHASGQAKFLQQSTLQNGRRIIRDTAKAVGRIKR